MSLLQLSVQSFASAGDTVSVLPLSLAADTAVTYEWFSVDDDETVLATGTQFKLPTGLHQSSIKARAIYPDTNGAPLTVLSEAFKVNAAPTGVPAIAGTFKEDGLLSVVSPSAIADLDGLGEFPLAYQWFADGVEIPHANVEFLPLTQEQVGKRISVRASYTDGDGKAEVVFSSDSPVVSNLNDAPMGNLMIQGLFEEGQTLEALVTDLADEDGLPLVLRYLWTVDGVLVHESTTNLWELGQLQVGKTIGLSLQFTDLQGNTERLYADNEGLVANVNDPTQGSLKIEGEVKQGAVLQADTTHLQDDDGKLSFTYQWTLAGVAIQGANQATIHLDSQQFVGKKIGLKVVPTDPFGFVEPVFYAETSAVLNINDLPTGSVKIEGDLIEDATLTAVPLLQDADGMPIQLHFQWLADGQTIPGATDATLTLQQSQVGRRISVQVSFTDDAGTAESVTSQATPAIENVNDLPSGTLELSGKVREGETLYAVTTALSDEDNAGVAPDQWVYQWRADGAPLTGATGSSLLLTQAHVGQQISLVVKFTDKQGQTETVTSADTVAVANENNKPTGTVTVTGVAQEDAELIAKASLADKDGLGTLYWRWLADGQVIAGEERNTLVLKQGQVGKRITAEAYYTDLLGQQESVASTGTALVANVQDPFNLGDPPLEILGAGFQGQTLSAKLYVTDDDGIESIAYQWLVNGTVLAGANQDQLTLTQDQVGRLVGVRATVTDAFGAKTVLQANQQSPIENINDAPTVASLVLSGPASKSIKGNLTASDADGDPFTFLLSQSPSHGQITLNEKTGAFEYVPVMNYAGLDQFSYQATDGKDDSAQATVQINLASLASRSVTGQVYFWAPSVVGNGRQLLQNVEVKAEAADVVWRSAATAKSGTYLVSGLDTAQVGLSATKITTADATVKPAIGLNDVLSALKLYLGKTTADSSPYAMIAADIDANGKVELNDVLNILKTYLGKAASVTPQWTFVDASAQLGGLTAKACAAPALSMNLVDPWTSVQLVGVLRGDVNGSWSQQSGYDLFTG